MNEPVPIRPSLDDSWFTTEPQLHSFTGELDEDQTQARSTAQSPSS